MILYETSIRHAYYFAQGPCNINHSPCNNHCRGITLAVHLHRSLKHAYFIEKAQATIPLQSLLQGHLQPGEYAVSNRTFVRLKRTGVRLKKLT